MSKKVCAFVWNHFTNDARVLRECTALSQSGYDVDLIAVHDWQDENLPLEEQHKNGFRVIRVKNRIKLFYEMSMIIQKLKKKKSTLPLALLIFLVILVGLYVFTGWTGVSIYLGVLVLAAICLVALKKTKLAKVIVRAYIFAQMIRWGRKKRYDFYHCNDLNTLWQGLFSAKWFRRQKLIYDSHEVQTSRTGYDSPIFGMVEKFLLKFVDEMIAENHTRAKYNEDLYGLYPHVVHNYPIPTHPEQSSSVHLNELLELPTDEPILLYQGGIQKGRGLDKIVEAVPFIERGTVVFIGDGKIKPQLVQMVSDAQLEERVKFIPKVPVDDLLHYTKNAYLGFQVLNNINFNHYSASSNKLFEYMMSGVPVIACSFPEIQKVVETENVGICVDSHDPASIAEGVNYLLNHTEAREQMSVNALHARDKYNWENEKEIFLKIYETA